MSGNIVATYQSGQVISFTTTITAYHGGWHEIWLCPKSVCGSLSDFTHRAIALAPSGTPGCPTSAPASSTDQPCLSDAKYRGDLPAGSATFQFQLPSGFSCAHCTMMWWWITNNYGAEHFKSCHDITINP